MKRAKKDNYAVLKQVAVMSNNLATQMSQSGAQIDSEMTKMYL